MSRFLKAAALGAVILLCAGGAQADTYGLGRPATADEVKAWNTDIRPDGQGLPEGSGSVEDGERIYTERCAECHGDFGEGKGRWPVLAGGKGTLKSRDPVKTIGSYWPYLSTVWDYVHRAMPFGDAESLSGDQVYAITAYLLYMNDLVPDDFVLSRENLLDVKMPNADGFYPDDRMETAVWKHRDPCMKNCKTEVKIVARARVIDVTPEDETSKHRSMAPVAATQVAAAPADDMAQVEAGKKVFNKCKACHDVGDGAKHKIGPQLNDIVGRKAGTADGFKKYSKGMKEAGEGGLIWDDQSLDRFLRKPKDMIKQTKMTFSGLKSDQDVAAIIAYLRAASEK